MNGVSKRWAVTLVPPTTEDEGRERLRKTLNTYKALVWGFVPQSARPEAFWGISPDAKGTSIRLRRGGRLSIREANPAVEWKDLKIEPIGKKSPKTLRRQKHDDNGKPSQ